ncbi:metal-dependent hydrolase [Brachybacterium sp. YJGR34]|uniref:metal-dependent hydrolase n=1 Tax=Brachybacterium sp. YJGR34 TaxID=2059911 RepID=UPI001300603B|nr:metal-dependent hydrolase [Brachybacterium sp. YJGR34]
MMGGHHAISGTAAWMALAGSASVMGHVTGADLLDLEPAQVLAGAVVATGAALLPDIDHPSATISRSGGGITKALTRAVSSVAGHRGATHTLLAAVAFTALAVLASRLPMTVAVPLLGEVLVAPVLLVTVLCALGTRALKMVEGAVLPWAVGLGAGLLVALLAPEAARWLPAAVAIGVLTHLIGDLLTTDGIPFPTWPLVVKPPTRLANGLWQRSGDIAVPLLGDAGSAREWLLCTVLTGYAGLTTIVTLAATPWPLSP